MDEVVQHLEAALAAVESRLAESELFQDVKNRLLDVKNHAEAAVAELAKAAGDQAATPAAPADGSASSDQAAAAETPAAPAGGETASEETAEEATEAPVTDENGNAVTDPNAAR